MRYLRSKAPFRTIAFDLKSERIIAALGNASLGVWDRGSDQPIALTGTPRDSEAAFGNEEGELFSWTYDAMKRWLIRSETETATKIVGSGNHLHFPPEMVTTLKTPILSPTREAFFGVPWRALIRLTLATTEWNAFSILRPNQSLTAISIHPNGHTVAIAERSPRIRRPTQASLRVWELDGLAPLAAEHKSVTALRERLPLSGEPIFAGEETEQPIQGLAYTSGGNRLLVVGRDWCEIREVPSYTIVSRFDLDEEPTATAVSPNGRIILVGTDDRQVIAYDAETGIERDRFSFNVGRVTQLVFAPDGLTAAACGGTKRIAIWDVE